MAERALGGRRVLVLATILLVAVAALLAARAASARTRRGRAEEFLCSA